MSAPPRPRKGDRVVFHDPGNERHGTQGTVAEIGRGSYVTAYIDWDGRPPGLMHVDFDYQWGTGAIRPAPDDTEGKLMDDHTLVTELELLVEDLEVIRQDRSDSAQDEECLRQAVRSLRAVEKRARERVRRKKVRGT